MCDLYLYHRVMGFLKVILFFRVVFYELLPFPSLAYNQKSIAKYLVLLSSFMDHQAYL